MMLGASVCSIDKLTWGGLINHKVKTDQNIDQSKPWGMVQEQCCHYTDDDKAHECVQMYSSEPEHLSFSCSSAESQRLWKCWNWGTHSTSENLTREFKWLWFGMELSWCFCLFVLMHFLFASGHNTIFIFYIYWNLDAINQAWFRHLKVIRQ